MISLTNSIFQARSYATLKDIQMRLKSIKNIGKITKSMKMIASTKLNRAQKAMEVGKTFSETSAVFLNHIEAGTAATSTSTSKSSDSSALKAPQLLIACSSDRGLCGAIHSSVSKFTKKLVEEASGRPTQIVILGDKAKPQIARTHRKNIVMSFNQVGKDIPTFTDAIGIVQLILNNNNIINNNGNGNNDKSEAAASSSNGRDIKVIYNTFKSVIAYETIPISVFSDKQLLASPKLASYEYEDSVLEGYSQFLFASQVFRALVEGHASEMSAKRMAMENASKNSDAIVLNLTMIYNRTRQSVITNELVDIITGASAL